MAVAAVIAQRCRSDKRAAVLVLLHIACVRAVILDVEPLYPMRHSHNPIE